MGDWIAVIPISMPSRLGTEMQIGYGSSLVCPAGTGGAGTNLAEVNRAHWLDVAPIGELRSMTEAAWVRAIALHMELLPISVPSVIAYGGIFGDDMAATRRIATDEVPRYAGRLWSMYTNLQPALDEQGDLVGTWSDWCPSCDQVLKLTSQGGRPIGLQLAANEAMDEESELRITIDDAIERYQPRFLEVNPEIATSYASYLFGEPNSVQTRIRAVAKAVDDVQGEPTAGS
ncbi:MAG: hypothetical protein ACXWW5_02170 [Actinomycetota bacterium]